jgi:hypothetical protein
MNIDIPISKQDRKALRIRANVKKGIINKPSRVSSSSPASESLSLFQKSSFLNTLYCTYIILCIFHIAYGIFPNSKFQSLVKYLISWAVMSDASLLPFVPVAVIFVIGTAYFVLWVGAS